MFTMKESLALRRGGRLHHGRHQASRTVREINAGKRLIGLERPRVVRLGVNMTPVVQAETLRRYSLEPRTPRRRRRVSEPSQPV
jgi:hypothetical protein